LAPERLLPAFVRYDCGADAAEEIGPPEHPSVVFAPEHFGDNWSEQLESAEVTRIAKYFRSFSHLQRCLDFINVRVGGRDNVVELRGRKFGRGITFEAPRQSLMLAVDNEIFDDLLIGNFMKTTLHGRWTVDHLYPDFTPFVAKYGDNGGARSQEELASYFDTYREARILGVRPTSI
jgi:hypothetical protein